MKHWPSYYGYLPHPSQAYSLDLAPSSIRTQMDSGTARQRRRFSTELVFVDVTWELDNFPQTDLFINFVKHELNAGNDWFYILLPTGGNYSDGGVFTIAPIAQQIARFVEGKYSMNYLEGGFWAINATLEIQSRPTLGTAGWDATKGAVYPLLD